MTLNDLVKGKGGGDRIRDRIERLDREDLCPRCGGEAEHLRGNEWRCNNDCKVLTYIHTDFRIES